MWAEELPSCTHTPSKQPASLHRLAIKLELEGPAIPVRKASSDVYVPKIRTYGSSYGSHVALPSVEHVDNVTTWKGIPIAGAAELCFWERVFKECLTRQIEDVLIARFYKSENDLAELPETEVAHLLYIFLRQLRICEFPINLEDLCADMIGLRTKRGGRTPWLGGKDLPFALLNFLHSRECFVGVNPRCSVWVDFTRDFFRSCHGQYLHGYLIWQPHTIKFEGLEDVVVEGSGYCLSPSVHEPVVLEQRPAYTKEVAYYFSSSDVSMQWNPAIQSFCGVVPAFRQHQRTVDHRGHGSHKSFLAIECVLTHSFPANVRLERVIRTRIALTVVPAPTIPLPTYTWVRPWDSTRAPDGRRVNTKRRNVFRDISNGQWRDPETPVDRHDSAMNPPMSVRNIPAFRILREVNNGSETWNKRNVPWSPSYDATSRSSTADAVPRARSDNKHSASLRSDSIHSNTSCYRNVVSKRCRQETFQPPFLFVSDTDTEEAVEMPYIRNVIRTPTGNPQRAAYFRDNMSKNPAKNPAKNHSSAIGILPTKTRSKYKAPINEHSSPLPLPIHPQASPYPPRGRSNSPADSISTSISSSDDLIMLNHEDDAVLQAFLASRKRARADSGTFEGCSFVPLSESDPTPPRPNCPFRKTTGTLSALSAEFDTTLVQEEREWLKRNTAIFDMPADERTAWLKAHGYYDEHVVNKRARIGGSLTRPDDDASVVKNDPTEILKQMKDIREFYALSLRDKRIKMEKMRDRSSEDSDLRAFEEIFMGSHCDEPFEEDLV